MGGYGSGRNINRIKRKYLDDFLNIDINFLNKHHALAEDTQFSLSWGDETNPVASMAITVKDGCLEILYNQKTDNGYGGPCEDQFELVYTGCNYGYRRPWFACPCCGVRVAKLYHLESGFICRKCSGLPYQSQSETVLDRSIRKASKIRERLGGASNLLIPILIPPKGMHWKKFDRLRQQLEQIDFWKR